MAKILNYTTSVEATKTVAEIQQILAKHGVRSVSVEYDSQMQPDAVKFLIFIHEQPITYRLPVNVANVLETMQQGKGIPLSRCTTAQARRVAWRIVKDWLEAQLALVQAGQAETAEVFLSYATDESGQTFFKAFTESKRLQLEGKQQLQIGAGN